MELLNLQLDVIFAGKCYLSFYLQALHFQLCISLTIQLFTQIFQLYLQIQRNLDSYSIKSKSCFPLQRNYRKLFLILSYLLKLLIVDLIMSRLFLTRNICYQRHFYFLKIMGGIVTQTDLNYQIEPLYVLKENFKQNTLAVKRGV